MSFYHFAYVICNAFVKVGFKFRAEGVENLPQTGDISSAPTIAATWIQSFLG
jgi:hypothetical protein